MKKKNNKGFTLVELLAVITIMGILLSVAVGAVFVYLQDSKEQAMDTIASTAYDGAVMYMMDNNVMLNEGESLSYKNVEDLTLEGLYEAGRIERPSDPYNSADLCDGGVIIKNNTTSSTTGLEDYSYQIIVECSKHKIEPTFPKK